MWTRAVTYRMRSLRSSPAYFSFSMSFFSSFTSTDFAYPPPVEDLDRYRERWNDTQRRRADFHLFEPTKPYCDDRTILIAGCGTSQAAKYAVRWPNAKITSIDISHFAVCPSGVTAADLN